MGKGLLGSKWQFMTFFYKQFVKSNRKTFSLVFNKEKPNAQIIYFELRIRIEFVSVHIVKDKSEKTIFLANTFILNTTNGLSKQSRS